MEKDKKCGKNCGDGCSKEDNCKCDEENNRDKEYFDLIDKVFKTSECVGEIVLVTFGITYEKHVIGRIYDVKENGIILFDVFEVIPDLSDAENKKSLLTNFARGIVSQALFIPGASLIGIPDEDVKASYLATSDSRRRMVEAVKGTSGNVFTFPNGGNKTIQ